MQNRLVRSRENTLDLVTCTLRIETTDNPKLSLLCVLILCSGVVKESSGRCNGTLLSSVMRVGFVCMRVMNVHMYGIDLVRVIFRSAFANDAQPPPQASRLGGRQLQLSVTFGDSTE